MSKALSTLRLAILVLILGNCAGVGTTTSSLSGGDSTDSGSGSTGGDDDGTGDTGGTTSTETSGLGEGPVYIPVTIAKATTGIDPATLQFLPTSNNLSSPLPRLVKKAALSGTFSGSLIDTSVEKEVCSYADGVETGRTTTVAGAFEFSGITCPTEVTLLVCTGGPPVTAQISKACRLTVVITNVKDTSRAGMAVYNDTIYFSATDDEGNPAIAKIARPGALAEKFGTSLTAFPEIRGIGSDLGPMYVESDGGIFSCNTEGTCTEVAATEDPLKLLKINTNGDYAYTDKDGMKIYVNGKEVELAATDCTVYYREFDWITASTLLILEGCEDGSGSRVIEKDVSSMVTPDLAQTNLIPDLALTVANYSTGVSCNGEGDCFALFDDGLDNKFYELHEYTGNGFDTIFADRPIADVHTCSGGKPIFQVESGEILGDQLVSYNPSTGETVFESRSGATGRCTSAKDSFIFFCKSEETTQVCFFKPAFDTVEKDVPAIFSILASKELTSGACSSEFLVATADSFGTMTAATVDTTVNLTASSSGCTFYGENDPTCSGTTITQLSIPKEDSHTAFYCKASSTAGTYYLHATDAADLITKSTWKMVVE